MKYTKNRKRGLRSGLILSILIFLSVNVCTSVQNGTEGIENRFVYVENVQGKNEEDFELNAKRKILEKGLGELIEGGSQTIDGQIKETVTNSSIEGYVTEFSRMGSFRKIGNLLEADAKGKVSRKLIEDSLKERYKELGKPKFLMIIDETILGKSNNSISENAIVKKFIEFDFLEKSQLARVLTKQSGKSVTIYGNQTLETEVLSTASEMGAQILLVGQTQVTNAGEIENSELKSYQAVIRFKIYDVNTKRIIAADNTSGAVLHVNPDTGIQEAIQKAVEKIYPKIREQISIKWKPGNLILLKIEGISYDDYVDKDIKGLIRGIKGVNRVSEVNVNQPIVLEIEALYNGNNLYQKMRERKTDFGFDFSQKEIKSSLIHIIKK
ncbi:hypothetical protein LEP1GSC034_4706 [Leptospira interrogans str. 2003000735]|uniref:Lipoprotein n=1 Tax=Leptospira interrogans serovar Zanoni str. LT2156 TaxID=1001601 RepID=M6HIM7_LEPIR|nr:hypothetical protein [Leptospira interrogans]EMM95212.1 hypothetical protein LEP1GSC158_0789 [Leptospira interrogans serovar Zanoni str. LT2156]EJP04522.1 hypothetical protein LEP1GSC007_2547 [Leptospira interrogans serovar Bulgarica str. Mallika]EKN89381.1 hypothetical protein LEP1GSC027_0450 [Leptospira interrogans str. 2002000624]EKQ38755.1 hypothetical protein LEP1GSC025_1898 [Leptospira interrogans str. 2002000621]EKQ45519.1 hypothetical protein LEP1GSC026_2157 [Leptospira interrogans 